MDTRVPSTTSIAMCTYNGERFLREQLDSIAAQSRLPDELVICDDCSTDSTREILNRFAATANFPVKLHFNDVNLGFVKNFEKTISLCSGEVIFLCDQDDVWRKDKLEVMQKYFSDPEVGMVFSNAAIIDETGRSLNRTLWKNSFFTDSRQRSFRRGNAYQILYLKTIVSGCTMAFSRELWPLITPLPTDILFIHDAWIAFMCSLLTKVVPVDAPLISYRAHDEQTTSPIKKRDNLSGKLAQLMQGEKDAQYKKHLQQIGVIREQLQRIAAHVSAHKMSFMQQHLREHEIHLLARTNRQHNRLPRYFLILRELIAGRYHRYSNGMKSMLADFYATVIHDSV